MAKGSKKTYFDIGRREAPAFPIRPPSALYTNKQMDGALLNYIHGRITDGNRQAYTQDHSNTRKGSNTSARAVQATFARQTEAYKAALLAAAEARRLSAEATLESPSIEYGEIIAWRIWIWDNFANILQSIVAHSQWKYNKPMHGIPSIHNKSGVYSLKNPSDAKRIITSVGANGVFLVLGTVKIWGDVIEYEKGYKSEFAQVHSIETYFFSPYSAFWGDDPPTSMDLKEVRKLYNVENNREIYTDKGGQYAQKER